MAPTITGKVPRPILQVRPSPNAAAFPVVAAVADRVVNAAHAAAGRTVLRLLRMDLHNFPMDLRRHFRTDRHSVEGREAGSADEAVDQTALLLRAAPTVNVGPVVGAAADSFPSCAVERGIIRRPSFGFLLDIVITATL